VIDESTLTAAEKELIAQFRAQMGGAAELAGEPDGEVKPVSVVNESLGQTPRGEKIQFRGGKPGWKPEPALRGFARFEKRMNNQNEARAAAKARAEKGRNTTLALVQGFKDKLGKMNVAQSVAFIQELSEHDRERAVLAEELGGKRKTVLDAVGKVSEAVRAEYAAQVEELSGILKDD